MHSVEQGTQTNEVHVLGSSFLQPTPAPPPSDGTNGQHNESGPSAEAHVNHDDSQLKQLNDEIMKLSKFRVKVRDGFHCKNMLLQVRKTGAK